MENLNVAFYRIAELHQALKLPPLNTLDGLWVHQVDDTWTISVNGHAQEVANVPAFHALVEYNGWTAGVINPYSGVIAAEEAANEDTFIAALDQAIKQEAT